MKVKGFIKIDRVLPDFDLSSHFENKFYLPHSIDNPLFRTNRPDANDSAQSGKLGENIDVDWSMKMMDKLWNATLYEFIRSQENCECTARYVGPLLKEYGVAQIVQGLTWILTDWKAEMKARFLRLVFSEYDPEYAGLIFSKLSKNWEFDKDITMNAALLLIKEPAINSAKFIATISTEWDAQKIVELIGCLDVILDWEEKYFQEFTLHVIEIVRGGKLESESKADILLRQLTFMYEMNLAQTNLKLAMADYQLALTEHKIRHLATIDEQE